MKNVFINVDFDNVIYKNRQKILMVNTYHIF